MQLRLALEFLGAMKGDRNQFGVLLSGPNGVGKSVVGLLSFLAAFAQRLPVVYIPFAIEWVTAARTDDESAAKYFLDAFLAQNAGERLFTLARFAGCTLARCNCMQHRAAGSSS